MSGKNNDEIRGIRVPGTIDEVRLGQASICMSKEPPEKDPENVVGLPISVPPRPGYQDREEFISDHDQNHRDQYKS